MLLVRVLMVTAMVTMLTPATAWPCMNPITLAGNRAVKRVKAAERLLDKGKYAQAADQIDIDRYEFADEGLRNRARLIYAVALLRGGSNPEYALDLLTVMNAEQPDAPVIQARLAEALVLGDGLVRGRALIEDLAGRDLVPDAHGWVTLAAVRFFAEDDAGAKTALARCRKVAKKKSICRLPASDA